ncbi:MAG TPA: sigma-70 family RNA polymerase sigma factor [Methylomirabilota bacterium]
MYDSADGVEVQQEALAEGALTVAPRVPSAIAARLHARSGAERWHVSTEAFAATLERSVAHRFPDGASDRELRAYLDGLHLEDLALALACQAGDDAAWEHFVRELRPALYAAARTLAGDASRELADSLYAELFGLPGPDGARRSLLAYYHGRSRLVTWLRSVLVQRHVDAIRAGRRLRPFDPEGEELAPAAAGLPAAPGPDPDRDRYIALAQQALDAAIDALEPRDRLRLRLYYGQDLTLARIGRLLGEHEATVSRHLARARKALRRDVERRMADVHGLADAEIRACFEHAAEAPELGLDRLLSGAEDG